MATPPDRVAGAERRRLAEDLARERNWKRWGPYLSERQWGTVREDYSARGDAWSSFPHDHARSRAYRWGEDGLLGLCDREGRLCFALALWNGRDPILKERLFGLSGPEGNHGEDAKEQWFYLDATPTGSWLQALYRYPIDAFPYAELIAENHRRSRHQPEYELIDTGVLDDGRFVDVVVTYAKGAPDDILVRVTLRNHHAEAARLHVLPTLWFQNSWSWGRSGEGYWPRPRLRRHGEGLVAADHESLGRFWLAVDAGPGGEPPPLLFTENETNAERLWGVASATRYVKDAFHAFVVEGDAGAVNAEGEGTKCAAHYALEVPARGEVTLRLRLFADAATPHADAGGAKPGDPWSDFEAVFAARRAEADAFHAAEDPAGATEDERRVMRQGRAGLVWSKQFYHFIVRHWLEGDPGQPPPPESRWKGRNVDWRHAWMRDVLSMPDPWEYPWFAAWDMAFHMIPFARLDPDFAKEQLVLLLREWYMHPNGQIPAYEWELSDVNPPVHAWAAWHVYAHGAAHGAPDHTFLARVFQKLALNFTWWVNRKDADGNGLFAGGFLGLDNIGVFDRSRPLPGGGTLEQADGTAWVAFFACTMLRIAIELARGGSDVTYGDMASKYFEHFAQIADAMNELGGAGLWDEEDGFYYDHHLLPGGRSVRLRLRSVVGLLPLIAVIPIDDEQLDSLPGFSHRLAWFLDNHAELAHHVEREPLKGRTMLAIASRDRLVRVLRYMLDEAEFLSPYGIRSLSRVHRHEPYVLVRDGEEHRVHYEPAESSTGMFGGNSNWRGPIWLPVNFLLIEALERYHAFYGDDLKVECPTGSGRWMNLAAVADELRGRLCRLVLADEHGRRPAHGADPRWADDPAWRDLALFYEYFDGDTGRGVGASHQTGWTALLVTLIEERVRRRHPDGG